MTEMTWKDQNLQFNDPTNKQCVCVSKPDVSPSSGPQTSIVVYKLFQTHPRATVALGDI